MWTHEADLSTKKLKYYLLIFNDYMQKCIIHRQHQLAEFLLKNETFILSPITLYAHLCSIKHFVHVSLSSPTFKMYDIKKLIKNWLLLPLCYEVYICDLHTRLKIKKNPKPSTLAFGIHMRLPFLFFFYNNEGNTKWYI